MKKIFILYFILLQGLWAVMLSPISQEVNSESMRNMTFEIHNPSNESVAVEIETLEVVGVKEHQEIRVKTDDMVAFPLQLILEPKERRKLRVNYIPEAIPENERVFRLMVTELDIDLSDEEKSQRGLNAQIKMRFSYAGIILVGKEEGKALFVIDKFNSDENNLSMLIKNSGNKSDYLHFSRYAIYAETDRGLQFIKKEHFSVPSFKRILPGHSIEYVIKNPFEESKISNIYIKGAGTHSGE